jgi:hypothetical protein
MLAAPPVLNVAVSPAKAGSQATPRPVGVTLTLLGQIDASSLVVYFPKQLRITNAGLPQCSLSDAKVASGGCADAEAGTGTAIGNGTVFSLTPLVGAKDLLFRLGGQSSGVLHGKLSQASGPYTAKMRLALPQGMRPLTSLRLAIKRTAGGASLFSTRGCPLPFKVQLNGAKTTTLTAKAACSRR